MDLKYLYERQTVEDTSVQCTFMKGCVDGAKAQMNFQAIVNDYLAYLTHFQARNVVVQDKITFIWLLRVYENSSAIITIW